MALNLKKEVLENIVNSLNAVTGERVLNGMDCVARLVKENEGNAIISRVTENCRKMQDSYNNSYVPAARALLQEYQTMEEFRTIIEKAAANMSDVKTVGSTIQVDAVELPEL